jgi:hypothetical protein
VRDPSGTESGLTGVRQPSGDREGEMQKIKRGSAIIALVLALAAFAAAPASARPGNGNGPVSDASWGEASWVESTISAI